MSAGYEMIVDAFDCRRVDIDNLTRLRAVCTLIIHELDLHLVGTPQWHQFPEPGGVTGMYLLRESHLTCHTFPECGLATFNLYCCRQRPDWPWAERLRTHLGARRVAVRRIRRGPETDGREGDGIAAAGVLIRGRPGDST